MGDSENNTALLIMDVQPGIIDRLGGNKEAYLERVQKAVGSAHKRNIPVIFVVIGFRPGLPEVSESNRMFGRIKADASSGFINPQPAIKPEENDIVATKRRVSAFAGSDLEVVLRGRGVKHIVLAGIATSGVVLSTLREAADKDYQITVLADICNDADEEVHRILTEKVFPRQAEVTTSEEWA